MLVDLIELRKILYSFISLSLNDVSVRSKKVRSLSHKFRKPQYERCPSRVTVFQFAIVHTVNVLIIFTALENPI